MQTKTGYPCEKCGHKTAVIDSRQSDGMFGVMVVRKRRCAYCGHISRTVEVSDGVLSSVYKVVGIRSTLQSAINAIYAIEARFNKK